MADNVHADLARQQRYAVYSSAGGREINEDSALVRDYSSRRVKKFLGLMAVADGMGGHQAGDVASGVAIERLQSIVEPGRFSNNNQFRETINDVLWQAFSTINSHIFDLGATSPEKKGMGTTLTCAVVDNDSAYVAHVGDSRAYLISGPGISQITEDHSLVGKMLTDGVLTEEQAQQHEKRNVLTRAIGPSQNVEIDILRVAIKPGDTLFLCTDGLHSMINKQEIAQAIADSPDLQIACRQLVEAAIARGADDNVTAVAWRMPGQQIAGATRGTRKAATKASSGLRWWAVTVIALLVTAIGFGIGWGVSSIWYGKKGSSKKAVVTESKPDTSEKAVATSPREEARVVTYQPGEKVVIALDSPGDPYNLRAEPSLTSAVVVKLKDGDELEIISGPVSTSWYKVQVTDPDYARRNLKGYVVAEKIVRQSKGKSKGQM